MLCIASGLVLSILYGFWLYVMLLSAATRFFPFVVGCYLVGLVPVVWVRIATLFGFCVRDDVSLVRWNPLTGLSVCLKLYFTHVVKLVGVVWLLIIYGTRVWGLWMDLYLITVVRKAHVRLKLLVLILGL